MCDIRKETSTWLLASAALWYSPLPRRTLAPALQPLVLMPPRLCLAAGPSDRLPVEPSACPVWRPALQTNWFPSGRQQLLGLIRLTTSSSWIRGRLGLLVRFPNAAPSSKVGEHPVPTGSISASVTAKEFLALATVFLSHSMSFPPRPRRLPQQRPCQAQGSAPRRYGEQDQSTWRAQPGSARSLPYSLPWPPHTRDCIRH